MADSAVAITAGAGTQIDTRTESTNGNHRQVVVLGDPSTNAGVAPVDATKGLAVDLSATGANATPLKVDGSAVTQPVSGSVSVSSGTVTANPAPATSGGCSTYHAVAAASTNTANIKASAGQVYGVDVFNNTTYPVYVKFHNTAGTPTAGSGVVRTFGVQAGVRGRAEFPVGLAFGTGIGISIVKNVADNDTTAVAASDCVVDVDYK